MEGKGTEVGADLTCGGEVCQGGVVVGDPVLVEAAEAGEAAVGGHEAAVAEPALVPAQHQLLLAAVTSQAQAGLQGRAWKYRNFYFIFFLIFLCWYLTAQTAILARASEFKCTQCYQHST